MNNNEIKIKVDELGSEKLVKGSHLYEKYGNINILDAAKKQIDNYDSLAIKKPGLALLMVILSANRSYSKHVEPYINKMEQENIIITISDLKLCMQNKSEFMEKCNQRNEKKYSTLVNIIDKIESILVNKYYNKKTDYEILNRWGKDVNIHNIECDPLRIKNFSLASIQHLRMTFGINTVKPDQRVLEVLLNEFQLKLNQKDAIKKLEEISIICDYPALLIDQIFVNYGSGYYQK